MKLLILLVLSITLAFASHAKRVYNSNCYYQNDTVYETGYAPRVMSNAERNTMLNYDNAWIEYGIQIAHYVMGYGYMPVPPALPCFCHVCY